MEFLLKGPPIIIARNNVSPMTVGETRMFQIDKNKKKECKLPGKGIIDIEIKKEQSTNHAFIFKMLGMEHVYIHCDDGYIAQLSTLGGAENCGIGKILTQLCLSEEIIHNVESNEKNKALLELKKHSNELQDDGKLKKLAKLEKWVSSYCSKLVSLLMVSNQGSKAHVYFNSAIASGFTDMFVIGLDYPGLELKFYPEEGPCSVKTLKGRYSDDGNMVDGHGLKKTMVWGKVWYFCLPKTQEKQLKCTIL